MEIIRSANASDTEAMLKIYSPHILESATSFETEVPEIDEFRRRVQEYQSKFP